MHDRAVNIAEQIWLLEPVAMRRLLAFADAAENLPPEARVISEPTAGPPMAVASGVATIPIHGMIMREVPSFLSWLGVKATGIDDVRAMLVSALGDPSVASINLDINSPGGSVAGIADLADDIYNARSTKPIAATGTDMIGSAAYWLGSQANTISSNSSGVTGSIGIVSTMQDTSKAAENAGVKVHVISSHELKGAATPGSEITEAQIADRQRLIDAYADQFVSAVARGRGVSEDKAREWATGQVWLGAEAQKMGLIDTVRTTGTQSAAHNSTAPAALVVSAKDTENMEELVAELAALKATYATLETECNSQRGRADAAVETLSAIKAEQVTNLIDDSPARVTPALRATVEKYAEATGNDCAAVKAFIDSLPVATRAVEQGSAEAVIADAAAVTDEDKQVAELMGITPQAAADDRVKLEVK